MECSAIKTELFIRDRNPQTVNFRSMRTKRKGGIPVTPLKPWAHGTCVIFLKLFLTERGLVVLLLVTVILAADVYSRHAIDAVKTERTTKH